jgi:hypothetical protein
MADLESAQHAETGARRGSNAGVLCGLLAVIVAVVGAAFDNGAVLTAGGLLGAVALVLGLSSSHQHGRASQWRGTAGFASVLGAVALVVVAFVALAD